VGIAAVVFTAQVPQRCLQGSGGENEGKRALGRPRLRWEDNIKMDFEEVGWVGMD